MYPNEWEYTNTIYQTMHCGDAMINGKPWPFIHAIMCLCMMASSIYGYLQTDGQCVGCCLFCCGIGCICYPCLFTMRLTEELKIYGSCWKDTLLYLFCCPCVIARDMSQVAHMYPGAPITARDSE